MDQPIASGSALTNTIRGSVSRISFQPEIPPDNPVLVADIHLPKFYRTQLTNRLFRPQLRVGKAERDIPDAQMPQLVSDTCRIFSSDAQSVPVRSAIEGHQWEVTPFLTNLINSQKITMEENSKQVLSNLSGGGIMLFSVLKIMDGDRAIHALQISDSKALFTPGHRSGEMGIWVPQGGYADIPLHPKNGDPELVFTPGFSGCSLTVDLFNRAENRLRVRHVQGGKENAEYNGNHIDHGEGMIDAMEYPAYGYHKLNNGKWCNNITGAAFMRYNRMNRSWELHYQGVLYSPSIISLETGGAGWFGKKDKIIARIQGSQSGKVTHVGVKNCHLLL